MMRHLRVRLKEVLTMALIPLGSSPSFGADNASDAEPSYTAFVRSHLDRVTARSVDAYGPVKTRMWLATINTATGGLPASPLPRELRWCRRITSPYGSNLYWDQPAIVAAYTLSDETGDDRFAASADAYIRQFLDRCVAPESGLCLCGNHVYCDVVHDQVNPFSGGYHECRPHTPAWEVFWRQDSEATAAAIRAKGLAHVKDKETGRFCRHANPNVSPGEFTESEVENAMSFREAGASLVESLC